MQHCRLKDLRDKEHEGFAIVIYLMSKVPLPLLLISAIYILTILAVLRVTRTLGQMILV